MKSPSDSVDPTGILDIGTDLTADERKTVAGAVLLGRRHLFDEPHGLHVARLAVSLFDQTIDLHELFGAERAMLLAAGVIHDIGMVVSAKRHHKHSMYLISESAVPGFTPHQVRLIALIARYHRKSEPSLHHGPFDALSGKDKIIVGKLSALLRVADGLDREHRQSVHSIAAQKKRKKLLIQCKTENGFHLDLSVFKAKTKWFEKVFRRRIVVSRGLSE